MQSIMAVRKNKQGLAALMIEKGAALDYQAEIWDEDWYGETKQTALEVAIEKDCTALLTLLLKKGALIRMLVSNEVRRSGIKCAGELAPAVLVAQAEAIVALLQSRNAVVRETALLALDKISLPPAPETLS